MEKCNFLSIVISFVGNISLLTFTYFLQSTKAALFLIEIFVLCLILSFLNFSVSVSLFMLAKLVAKLETHVGNYIVWNMEFNLMGKCQVTKP